MDGLNQQIKREYGEYVIDAHSPETISMARLAEYIGSLALMLGKSENLHFDKVEPGSLKIRFWTPIAAAEEALKLPMQIAHGEPSEEAVSAFRKLNDLLEADRAIGSLNFSGVVVPFPGRERPHVPVYGPFEEELSIEGQLVSIGGKDASIHAQIRDGFSYHKCQMNRALAVDMCHYLFGPVIRVTGKARFRRDRDGQWEQLSFTAASFEELDSRTLSSLIEDLQSIRGNGWRNVDDPFEEIRSLRGDN